MELKYSSHFHESLFSYTKYRYKQKKLLTKWMRVINKIHFFCVLIYAKLKLFLKI